MSMKQILYFIIFIIVYISSIQDTKALSSIALSPFSWVNYELFTSSQDGYYMEKAKEYMREAEYYTKKAGG